MQTNVYPGILDNSIEFFTSDAGVNFIQSRRVKPLHELSYAVIEKIKNVINNDVEAKEELESVHPNSEWQQIEMFVKCRYGGLDFTPDVIDGEFNCGDYWDCPLRGSCASEGKICKVPTYNSERLSFEEVKLIKLLTTNMTNESISFEMNLPLGSFHLMKKKLYEKLQIQTKQELTIIAIRLNLISV